MKPLKLTMQAFGSYGKNLTTIDFNRPNQNLFLITGDTGAGKTTIFDAIVFAIYGEAGSAKNKKDGIELQSQYVDYGTEPFVELSFSEKSGEEIKVYTVRRVPRHVRPLKRGSGVKEESEKLSLLMPDGTEYPQKEANQKLEEIVGLTKGQFMQVVMIAQGEFMELLRAKSDDKKVIFRKLFHTEFFRSIVDELGKRRKEKLSEIAGIRTVCQTEVGHIVVPERYEEGEELQTWKQQILSMDKLSVTKMEALLEALNKLCDRLKADRESAERAYEQARGERDEKRDTYTAAQGLSGAFEELEEAERILAECSAMAEEMEAAAQQIGRIYAAYDIQGLHRRFEDAENTLSDTDGKLKEQQAVLPELEQAYQGAAVAEDAAKKCRDAELEAYTKVSERVQKALERFEKIKKAQKDFSEKQKEWQTAKESVEEVRTELADLEVREQEWQKQSEELKDAEKLLERFQYKKEEMLAIEEELTLAKQAQTDVLARQKQAEQAAEEYKVARQNFVDKNTEYVSKQNAFLDAQAGLIAREKLRPGEACPVCGSTEHPKPCEIAEEHRELTREVLEELAKEEENLRQEQEQKAGEANLAAELLAEKTANLENGIRALALRMRKSVDNIPEKFTLPEAEEALQSRKQLLEKEGKQLEEDAARFGKAQKALKGMDVQKQSLKEAFDQATQKEREAETAFTGVRKALEILEAEREYPSEEEAREALKTATAVREETDSAYQNAHQAADKAKQKKENAEVLIERYQAELPKQREECSRRKAAYVEIMADRDQSEHEWKDLVEKYPKSEAVDLQNQVDAYREKKALAEGKRETARKTIGEQKRPDLAELEQEKKEAEEKLTAIQGELEQYKTEYQTNFTIYQALAPKMEERGMVMQEYGKIDSLYSRLAGNVTDARMDIETFVQRYYLQRILYDANARFRDMSAGQYELRMLSEEQAGSGRNRGLDLMVYSTVTGKEREIRTLSGGESFMAALALALGMADRIQENSAAINLDMMFIDEGFGSLDEHSRNQAVKVLQQMANGSKLIGIISHVSELKQEIEDQLLVSKDEEGSHVKWQIS